MPGGVGSIPGSEQSLPGGKNYERALFHVRLREHQLGTSIVHRKLLPGVDVSPHAEKTPFAWPILKKVERRVRRIPDDTIDKMLVCTLSR
jgi:hypothetical protein